MANCGVVGRFSDFIHFNLLTNPMPFATVRVLRLQRVTARLAMSAMSESGAAMIPPVGDIDVQGHSVRQAVLKQDGSQLANKHGRSIKRCAAERRERNRHRGYAVKSAFHRRSNRT